MVSMPTMSSTSQPSTERTAGDTQVTRPSGETCSTTSDAFSASSR